MEQSCESNILPAWLKNTLKSMNTGYWNKTYMCNNCGATYTISKYKHTEVQVCLCCGSTCLDKTSVCSAM